MENYLKMNKYKMQILSNLTEIVVKSNQSK